MATSLLPGPAARARAAPLEIDALIPVVQRTTVDFELTFAEEDNWYLEFDSTDNWYTYRDRAVLLGSTADRIYLLTSRCVADVDAPGHPSDYTDLVTTILWDSATITVSAAGVRAREVLSRVTRYYFLKDKANLVVVGVPTSGSWRRPEDEAAWQSVRAMSSLGIDNPEAMVFHFLSGFMDLLPFDIRGGIGGCPHPNDPSVFGGSLSRSAVPTAGGALVLALAGFSSICDGHAYCGTDDATKREELAQAVLLRFAYPRGPAPSSSSSTLGGASPPELLLVASPSWLDSHMTKLKEGAKDKGYPDGFLPVHPELFRERNTPGMLVYDVFRWFSPGLPPTWEWLARVTPEEAMTQPVFVGWPVDGLLFAWSPAPVNRYMPFAGFYEITWGQMYSTFPSCAASLLAREISISRTDEEGNNFSLDVDAPVVPVSGQVRVESSSRRAEEQTVVFDRPTDEVILEPDARCSPAWAELIQWRVRDGSAVSYVRRVQSTEQTYVWTFALFRPSAGT